MTGRDVGADTAGADTAGVRVTGRDGRDMNMDVDGVGGRGVGVDMRAAVANEGPASWA